MVENRPWLTVLSHIVLSIGVLVTALPIWITFVASTHPVEALMSGRTPLWPGDHFLQNYTTILGSAMEAAGSVPVGMMMWNSLIMALMIAIGKIAISIIAAYAIVYFRFPLRVQMRLEIKRLQRDLGTTSLYVTHDQVEAMTLADRLIVMNGGVAEQIGTPLDVYENPATVFVAGFIGSPAMNFLPGTVSADRRGVTLDGSSQALPVPPPMSASQDTVTVGLRPEHLEPTARDAATLELTVDLMEALGADNPVHGQLAGGALGSALTVRVDGARRIAAGETLPLAVAPEHVHFFEVGTGRRLV